MLLDNILLSAEGDADASGGGTDDTTPTDTPTTSPGAPPAAPWYAPAESLKTTHPEVWSSFENSVKSGSVKDLGGLILKGIGAEKKLGSAITPPAKDAKPEEIEKWTKDTNEKLKTLGLSLGKAPDAASLPPDSADKYNVNLEGIPESLHQESTITAVKGWAHKHGLSQSALDELIAIENQRYSEQVAPVIALEQEKERQEYEAWANSIGKSPQECDVIGGAWLGKHFSQDQINQIEALGVGGKASLMKLVVQAGLDSGEDISAIDGLSTAGSIDVEYDDVIKMTSDPNHKDYKLWWTGDPNDPKRQALQERYNKAFQKKHGLGPIA